MVIPIVIGFAFFVASGILLSRYEEYRQIQARRERREQRKRRRKPKTWQKRRQGV